MTHKSRVLIADDNNVVRLLVTLLIQESEDMEIVGEARDGSEAVELTKRLRPDAVVMDVNMPHMNGIEATQTIHSEFPQIRVIGLSLFDDLDTGEAMLDAGAVSCYSKDAPWDSILSGIRQVLASAVNTK